jgi:hypothetical protein
VTFDQLTTEVHQLTGRPDLVAQTKSAVKAATLKAHQSDYYSKDIYETGVQFEEATHRQCLDFYSLVSNFRALKYIRRVESETDEEGIFFDIITPGEVLDSYGCTRSDIAYVAGRSLEIRSSVTFSKALMGAYVLPVVTEGNYSSWVADLHPFAIIYEAARVLFKTIGFDEQASTFNALVSEEYTTLKMTGLADVGY